MDKPTTPVKRQWPKWLFSGLTIALLVTAWSLFVWVQNYAAEISRGLPRGEDVIDSLRNAEQVSIRTLPTQQIIFRLDMFATLTLLLRISRGLGNDLIILGVILGLSIFIHGFDLLSAEFFASSPHRPN